MKLKLLSILTLFSVSAFAQNIIDEGIGFPQQNNISYKTNQSVPIKASTCDTSFFYDDFEGNNVNQWITINTTPTTTTNNPAQGTYCMEHNGVSGHMQGFYADIGVTNPTEISWYVKTNTLNQHNAYVVIGDDNTQSNYGAIWVYVDQAGVLRFYANSQNDIQLTATANQWYHIQYKNIDFTAKTSDIYLDNVLLQANFPFRATSTSYFSRVHLYNVGSAVANYDSIRIGASNAPSINFSANNLLCNGDSTGAIDLTPSGGNAPYSFDWNTNDTIEDLSNLIAGNYIITLTDDSGCVAIDSVTVTEPTAITVTTDSLGTFLCNGDSTGAIFTTSSGGTPGYSYLWNTTDTVDDLTGLVAGTYMLSVTDTNNCVHVETITLTQPDTISTNATVVPESISGNDGSIDQSTSGGTPGYTYNWSTSDTTEDISGLAVGTYTVTITDANGCSKVIEYEVLSSVGINQISNTNTMNIYPNPATGVINVALDNPSAVEIFNAIGQQVMLVSSNKAQLTLNVSNLAKGVYYLKAGELTKRLVIK